MPGTPQITLNPDVIFFVVLPPLLYSAAWLTSWREFSYNLVSILFLAFGLVIFTVLGVARVAPWFLSGFDWRMGFVLGAVVAPTDAIAATSIATRIGLPKRIVDILEGESLVNDASGLLALEFGVAMLVTRSHRDHLQRPAASCLSHDGGHCGRLGGWLDRELGGAAYRPRSHRDRAQHFGSVCRLPGGRLDPRLRSAGGGGLRTLPEPQEFHLFVSPNVRLQAWAVWESLTFILNGLVFVLIGLQLPYVLKGIENYDLRQLLLYGAIFSALLIALRVFWT